MKYPISGIFPTSDVIDNLSKGVVLTWRVGDRLKSPNSPVQIGAMSY